MHFRVALLHDLQTQYEYYVHQNVDAIATVVGVGTTVEIQRLQ